ncbi:uncharacterized protein LOC130548531 [Triplophysa rosa]|uniref:uncharacterized protein LOC130548531 n=1 Tax=Triplophysa rosa TaxID=992332 RepID=UPI002545EAB2|nr:uncharacterized protein LOC130548531 [Triplophysa rosa]
MGLKVERVSRFIILGMACIDGGVSGDEDGETANEGSSVTLNSGLTELSKDDVIQWGFGKESTLIAEINKQADRITYYDVFGGRFTDRLKLDEQTGSLTITNITNEQTGYYKRIIKGVSKRLLLIVHAGDISVKEGASVTLNTNIAESGEGDFTEWLFIAKNKTVAIAYSTSGFVIFYKSAVQGIFRNKLKMDKQTGSLTITNVTHEQTGKYVFMTSNEGVHRSFNLTVSGLNNKYCPMAWDQHGDPRAS